MTGPELQMEVLSVIIIVIIININIIINILSFYNHIRKSDRGIRCQKSE